MIFIVEKQIGLFETSDWYSAEKPAHATREQKRDVS